MESTTINYLLDEFEEDNQKNDSISALRKPKEGANFFDGLDYSIFTILLSLTLAIGLYFAIFAKQRTVTEYLMGSKNMGLFPISFSLVASSISAISLLGMPAEVYTYGTQFALIGLVEFLVATANALFFLPVFYKLQLTSIFEYLELRYNRPVRMFLSGLSVLSSALFCPVVIYMPSLALSQVTGINLYIIAAVSCAVCVLYTSLGGLKAVVWTDTFQTFSMLTGIILITVMGTREVGGIENVFKMSHESGRIELFNMDANPLVRHTFWTIAVGNFFSWLSGSALSQAIHQRCLSLPTLTKARIALFSLATGSFLFVFLSAYTGLVAYAYYKDCDPLLTKVIKKPDQIIPYFVLEFSDRIPGLPGIFLGAIFSAALSTLSTVMNTASGVVLEDFIQTRRKIRLPDSKARNILKVIVVLMGLICISVVPIVNNLGTILQTSRSILGIVSGARFGIFVCGIFLPWVNYKGAIVGGFAGVLAIATVSFGSQAAIAAKRIKFITKPLSVEGCIKSNVTFANNLLTSGIPFNNHLPQHDDVFWMFRISYLYYPVMGLIVMVTVAVITSYFTGFEDISKLNPDLVSPICQRFLPKATNTEQSNEEINLTNFQSTGKSTGNDKQIDPAANAETEETEQKLL